MSHSMTGFARSQTSTDYGALTLEIRSVNHRYLDIALRLPEELRQLDPEFRQQIKNYLSRGRIDCQLRLDTGGKRQEALDSVCIDSLLELQRQLLQKYPDCQNLTVAEILNWPGVLSPLAADEQQLLNATRELLVNCLDSLQDSRRREGGKLVSCVRERLIKVRQLTEDALAQQPQVQQQLRTQLKQQLAELQQQLDTTRLEHEIVSLVQKADIAEELDRLLMHTDEVNRVLGQEGAIGRRLDFIMQELNREANTLGSKAATAIISQIAVELKVLIEQMREQIQNIE
ncbi:MAG TPA: YicC family protein [Gammaproteobacteria bacterium]|nr:YicC family protein [Gammaproteobacteria bacterium]